MILVLAVDDHGIVRDGITRAVDVVEQVRCADSSIPVLPVSSGDTADLWWDGLECVSKDILPTLLSASRLSESLGKPSQTME